MKRANKTRNCGTMTESAFWSFIRSMLRKGSFRWVPRKKALELARRPSQSTNTRLTWQFQCAKCKGWFAQKEVAIDHIEPCGALNRDTAGTFIERLYAESPQAFQILCKDKCHKAKTQEERRISRAAKLDNQQQP